MCSEPFARLPSVQQFDLLPCKDWADPADAFRIGCTERQNACSFVLGNEDKIVKRQHRLEIWCLRYCLRVGTVYEYAFPAQVEGVEQFAKRPARPSINDENVGLQQTN